jgi:hypothetical protein
MMGGMKIPDAGAEVFVVIVSCACPDRWWAQPEGGYFPLCRECGKEARPLGADSDLADLDARRESARGGVMTVMPEQEAVRTVFAARGAAR